MTSQDINTVMAWILISILTIAVFIRENASALDALADWAQARSWGLKCAKAEKEKRKQQRVEEVA